MVDKTQATMEVAKEAIKQGASNDRGFFLIITILVAGVALGFGWYAINTIHDITTDFTRAIAEQRQDFLQQLTQNTAAIESLLKAAR